jgi:hypothetical protein
VQPSERGSDPILDFYYKVGPELALPLRTKAAILNNIFGVDIDLRQSGNNHDEPVSKGIGG